MPSSPILKLLPNAPIHGAENCNSPDEASVVKPQMETAKAASETRKAQLRTVFSSFSKKEINPPTKGININNNTIINGPLSPGVRPPARAGTDGDDQVGRGGT